MFKLEKIAQKTQETIGKTTQTMGDTIVDVIDRLTGTKSEIRLSFQDLTLDTGAFKTKMTGAVVLQTVMAENAQTSTDSTSQQATVYNVSG